MTAPKKKARGVRATTVESAPQLDRAKLRDALRTIGDESVFYMLDEAIDLLPPLALWINRSAQMGPQSDPIRHLM